MRSSNSSLKYLVVILGPTASGKSSVAVDVASRFNSEVMSCDSRQFYREIPIGTAAPSIEEQRDVPHHFVASRSLTDEYSAVKFTQDALVVIDRLFKQHDVLFMVGGSGLYINALCDGMDDMPECDPQLRMQLQEQLDSSGLEALCEELRTKDAEYHAQVDTNNPQRVLRALEVIRTTGLPYSAFRKGAKAQRSFEIIKIGLTMPREILYDRINHRVDIMMDQGLEAEARAVFNLRHLNALRTIGYSEMFDYFEGITSRDQAVELIKRNSRRYAKRQSTWFGRDETIRWFESDNGCVNDIENFIQGLVW